MSRKHNSTQPKAEQATTTATPETPQTPAKPKARDLPCLCGCGNPTTTRDARFLSGHDAKLRKAVLEARGSWDAVPELARPFFLWDASKGGATAGLRVDDVTNPRWLADAKAERAPVPTGPETEEAEEQVA